MTTTRQHGLARSLRVAALVLLVLVTGLAAAGGARPPVAHAAGPVTWKYKGSTIASYAQSELGSANTAASLRQLAATGANSVTFVVTWYQDTIYTSSIYRTGNTAADAALITAMQEAEADGLKVVLKPQLDTLDGQWRAHIKPCSVTPASPDTCPSAADQASAWFASYSAMILHYADIASQQNAAALVIGAELIDMSTNPAYTSYWTSLIGQARAHFPGGALTYSANWGSGSFATEYVNIPFWNQLDYIGISAYFPLANSGDYAPTLDTMKSKWSYWQTDPTDGIGAFQQKIGKPVLFTEGGYRSGNGAAQAPFDNWDGWSLDTQQQANCYEATFEAWANVPWFAGEEFWNWETDPNTSGSNTAYSIQNKPAQQTMTNWFGGGAGLPAPATATNTALPAPATNTATNTPVPAATATNTALPAPATSTPVPTATATAPVSGGSVAVSLQGLANNAGTSSDNGSGVGNFDGQGYSYSAQALQGVGFGAGQTVVVNGVGFRWPAAAAGSVDNIRAQGQTVTLPAPASGASLAVLGAANNGPASGTGTIAYSDGTTQAFTLALGDWTLNGGGAQPPAGTSIAATMAYRDNGGRPETIKTYVFYAAVPLQMGKSVTRVTLPAAVSQGGLHLFALSIH